MKKCRGLTAVRSQACTCLPGLTEAMWTELKGVWIWHLSMIKGKARPQIIQIVRLRLFINWRLFRHNLRQPEAMLVWRNSRRNHAADRGQQYNSRVWDACPGVCQCQFGMFMVMPNHVHGIIVLTDHVRPRGWSCPALEQSAELDLPGKT